MSNTINSVVLGQALQDVIDNPLIPTDSIVAFDINYGEFELSDESFFEVERIINTYAPGDAEKIALDHLARWQYRNTDGEVRTALAALSSYLYRCVNIRNSASRSVKPTQKTENLSDLYKDLAREKPEYLIHLFRRAVFNGSHLEAMLPLAKCEQSFAYLESLNEKSDPSKIETCVKWAQTTATSQHIQTGAHVTSVEYSARRLVQIIKSISEYRTNHTASSHLRSFLLAVSSLTMLARTVDGGYLEDACLAADIQGLVTSTERLMVSNSVAAYTLINDHQVHSKMNYCSMIELAKLQHRIAAGEISLVFGLLAHLLIVLLDTACSETGARLYKAVSDMLRKTGIQTLYLEDQAENGN